VVSGLSDVLPVSSQAHKAIMLKLFGENGEDPLLRLFIHAAILAALYYCCSSHIQRIVRQLRLSRVPKKRRKRPLDVSTLMEFRLLRMMIVPALLGLLLYNHMAPWGTTLNVTAIFLLVNGVILFLPNLLATGNKDARSMSAFEGMLIGFGGGLSVLPGVSSIGAANAVASVCGAERTFALNLTYLMHMALTLGLIAFDVAAVFASGIGGLSFAVFFTYVVASVAAFFGAFYGIRIMRMLAVNIGFSIFAFYSFGAALLSFVLYLMV
jgi:undecaprenyl-diphosphatase